MKKLVSICLIGALMASLAGCAKTGKKQDEYILQIGTVLNEADPLYVALTEVFEKTGGRKRRTVRLMYRYIPVDSLVQMKMFWNRRWLDLE